MPRASDLVLVGALLFVGVTQGAVLRRSTKKTVAEVTHLLEDVQESVTRAGQEAEMVFTSLSSYGKHLRNNLKQEIATLNHTRASLLARRIFYSAKDSGEVAGRYSTEQKSAELSMNVHFTASVLKLDQEFMETCQSHSSFSSGLTLASRGLRQSQLRLLFASILANGSAAEERSILGKSGATAVQAGLSFLETDVHTSSSSSNLDGLSEIETAIGSSGNKHELLMRLKSQFDHVESMKAPSVSQTTTEFEGALHNLEANHSMYEEAKQHCESQKLNAKGQLEALQASIAFMSAAREQAQQAIRGAQASMASVEKKSEALTKSSGYFSKTTHEALKSLDAQSREHETIQIGLLKAAEIVKPALTAQLMERVAEDMTAQSLKDKAYRDQQALFEAEFSSYVKDYKLLLGQRRQHLEASLGALELHVSELSTDLSAQKLALDREKDFGQQGVSLCSSVLESYDKHAKTRADLSKALRAISLPPAATKEGASAQVSSI